jgi:hypothetical protein
MLERKNEPRAPVSLTVGAARERLIALGYAPTSALAPEDSHPWLVSEHPVAVRTLGPNPLALLILSPGEDSALHQGIQAVLDRRGLARGPVRIGSDQRTLWPLRSETELMGRSALNGAVEVVCAHCPGRFQGLMGSFLPLDGTWPRGDLLSVPYAKLPALSAEEADALFDELTALPFKAADARERPKPSRRAFLGGP